MSENFTHPGEENPEGFKMPQNMEAEQSILGTLLLNNEAMHHIGSELRPEHFYAGQHQRIYEEILRLIGDGSIANPITIKASAGRLGIDVAYLVDLCKASSSVINVHSYSKELIELALRRSLINAALEVVNQADELSSGDMTTVLANAVDRTTREAFGSRLHDSRTVSINVVEGMKTIVRRTPTGLRRLDRALGGGLMRGQAYGFAARRGEGKTMLGGTISHNLNHGGVKHMLIPIEMGEEEIQKRSLARSMNVPSSVFDDDSYNAENFCSDLGHHAIHDPGNVIYHDNAFLTFDALKRIVATGVAKHKIEGFILDYWQLVGGKPPKETKASHLENVAQWIAAACKEYDIWAILLAQLNRDGNIRDSDGLEMASSNIFYLHRPDPTLPGAWLEAKKARHSKFGHIGSAENPGMQIHENGSHFEELEFQSVLFSATKEAK